jgi:hypothetical protein
VKVLIVRGLGSVQMRVCKDTSLFLPVAAALHGVIHFGFEKIKRFRRMAPEKDNQCEQICVAEVAVTCAF